MWWWWVKVVVVTVVGMAGSATTFLDWCCPTAGAPDWMIV